MFFLLVLLLGICPVHLSSKPSPEPNTKAIETGKKSPNEEAASGEPERLQREIRPTTLYDTVKQGGIMMYPIFFLALIALTIIIERMLYFLFSNTWNRKTLLAFLRKAREESSARYREELEDDLIGSVQMYINRMEKGLNLLNGIGNLAPIVGFFGTVVGMIEAFAAIAAATTVNAKVVAVGIQIALITTAGGLAIAVPTLFFYHFFTHIIQKTYAQGDIIVQELSMSLPRISAQTFDNNPE